MAGAFFYVNLAPKPNTGAKSKKATKTELKKQKHQDIRELGTVDEELQGQVSETNMATKSLSSSPTDEIKDLILQMERTITENMNLKFSEQNDILKKRIGFGI